MSNDTIITMNWEGGDSGTAFAFKDCGTLPKTTGYPVSGHRPEPGKVKLSLCLTN
jgi:hypothetical protein